MKTMALSPGAFKRFLSFLESKGQKWVHESGIFWKNPVLNENHGALWMILIRAGSASLGFFGPEQKLLAHKRIAAYMTRKKQGKAQLTYLKTKGKSRAGSRYRLRESREFFEEINRKLQQWHESPLKPEKIFYLCPVGLIHGWFSSKVPPPFQKKDPRMAKIPFHLSKPTHETLKKAFRLLRSGIISGPKDSLKQLWSEFLAHENQRDI